MEGGYCRELFKSPRSVPAAAAAPDSTADRPLSSTIYYLLKAGQVSRFHRLKSDELWFFHSGDPLLIHQIDEQGSLSTRRLGLEVDRGDRPQIEVPAGVIFGAELAADGDYCLVSCMVSPGFDYHDFELLGREELLARYPQHRKLVGRLSG